MTLFLISPQPECVFTFFVSFIQNVQEPNKLYFLNLPSFCSVSFIKPPEGGPRRRLVGGEKQQDSSTPPCYCCILALGRWGVHFRKEEVPLPLTAQGHPLAVCALKCWQSYFARFWAPALCPISLSLAPPSKREATAHLPSGLARAPSWPRGVHKGYPVAAGPGVLSCAQPHTDPGRVGAGADAGIKHQAQQPLPQAGRPEPEPGQRARKGGGGAVGDWPPPLCARHHQPTEGGSA